MREGSKRSPRAAQEWRRRAARIRRALPDLLWGGPPPKRPKPAFRVVAEGRAFTRWETGRLREMKRRYPEDLRTYKEILPFSWPGPVTWTTRLIEYPGWPGHPPQRAILRIPHGARRAPALTVLHGHSRGLQLGCVEMAYLAVPLAAIGCVTLAPDAMPFGDRRLHTLDEGEVASKGQLFWDERVVASECWLRGETLLGRQIWELMVSLDLLQSLPETDPKRLGTIGCSQGGVQSWWLSAMDSRIAAAVVSAGVSTYASWIEERAINALFNYVPGILKLADQDELIGLIAPRPLLVCDCAKDVFFPRAGIERVRRFLRRVYRWENASKNYRHDLDPGGHGFPKRQRDLAMDWLREKL